MFSLAEQMAPLEDVVNIQDAIKNLQKYKEDLLALQTAFNEFLDDFNKESEIDRTQDNYRKELGELLSSTSIHHRTKE